MDRVDYGIDFLQESARFVVVGGFSFLIDIGSLALLQEMFFNRVGHGLFIATAIAFSISLCIHYFLSSLWVFRRHCVTTVRGHAKAGVLFIVTNVVGLGINEAMLWVGVSIMAYHYLPVKMAAATIAMVWNFLCQKFFIFRTHA